MMRKHLSRYGLIPFSVLLGLFLLGCGRQQDVIRVGYVDTGLTGLAVQVMKSENLPARFGLAFEYVPSLDPTALNSLFVLGKCDVSLAAGANVVALARSQGHAVQYIVPSLLNSVSILVKADSPYRTLADLKGKRIGWYGLASGGGTGFYLLARRYGLNPDADFEMIQSAPPALVVLLTTDEIAAATFYEPYVSSLTASGDCRSILGPFYEEWERETGDKMEMTGIAASEAWLDAHPDEAKRVVDLWRATAEYIKAHPGDVLRRFPDYTGLRNATELGLGMKKIPPVFVSNGDDLEGAIERMLQALAMDGVLLDSIPVGTLRWIGQ